jgi:hypothetical protein
MARKVPQHRTDLLPLSKVCVSKSRWISGFVKVCIRLGAVHAFHDYWRGCAVPVYRIHEGQASQTVSVQGLYDILDLWQLNEYAHWPSSDIADLVLTVLSIAVRSGSDWVDILEQIRRSGLALRVLRGFPRAVLNKALRKARLSAKGDSNYESPANLESAFRTAGAQIGN